MNKRQHEAIPWFAPAVLRRFLFAVGLVAVVLSCIVASLYIQDLRHHWAILEKEGTYLVALEQEFLSLEFRAVRSDLLYLARQEALKRFFSGDAAARAALESEYATFALSKAVYDQVRCLDETGQEIIRVNYRDGNVEVVPREQLQAKATRYYYQQALSLDKGQVFVSSFDLNVEHGQIEQPNKPVIRFLTPLFDGSGENRGFLILNYMGARLLGKLKGISAGFHGKTMLINQAGEYLLAPNPDHEWGWLRRHNHSFRRHFPDAWQRGKRLAHGQFRIGQDLFTFQRVSLAQRSSETVPASDRDDPAANSLLLVSYVSASVGTRESSKLLRQLLPMYAGTMALVMVLSFYWARSRAIHDHQENRLAESESRLRLLSSRLLAAQEDERRKLSRDLHDELGQQVTAISLDLQSAARENDGERAQSLLRRAINETGIVLNSLHEIASRVRPSVLDDLGLQDAVESFVSEYEQRTGIEVNCDLRFHRNRIPAAVGENVFRVLQEALSNVAAHAQTKEVSVAIEVVDNSLRMIVQDCGVGFQPEQARNSSRLGLLGMRERVELLNGIFEITSAPSEGTRIHVEVSLPDYEE